MYTDKVMEHFRNPKFLRKMEKPDGIGKVGNPTCLHPDTIVHANDSLVPINRLNSGTRVMGHDGHYNRVLTTSHRKYDGDLLQIKNKLGTTLLTPDHMVYAIKVPKTHWFSYTKNKQKFPRGWYHAYDLEKKDIAAYPISKEIHNEESIFFKQEKKKYDFRSVTIPERIPINDDFLRLSGYYLSEGSLNDKTTKTRITFSFNLKEDYLADDVVRIVWQIFNINAYKKSKKAENKLSVEINNVWIVRLFKRLFLVGAGNKRIPHNFMLLPPEKQKSLIYGLWKGDGFFNTTIPRAGYSTISKELCQQLKTLLLRQKIIPSIYEEEEKVVNAVKHRKSYRIHVGDRESLMLLARILKIHLKIDKKVSTDSWIDENYLYMPITRIEKKTYTGFVHNLEIESAKSYITDSLTVHNCGDLMWVYIKVGKKGTKEIIQDISVETFGCVAAVSSSDVLCALALGKTLEAAEKISREDIIKELGDLPPIKRHCSVLAQDGLHKAIQDYREKKK